MENVINSYPLVQILDSRIAPSGLCTAESAAHRNHMSLSHMHCICIKIAFPCCHRASMIVEQRDHARSETCQGSFGLALILPSFLSDLCTGFAGFAEWLGSTLAGHPPIAPSVVLCKMQHALQARPLLPGLALEQLSSKIRKVDRQVAQPNPRATASQASTAGSADLSLFLQDAQYYREVLPP